MIFHVRPIPSYPGYFVSDTGRVWGPKKEAKLRPWRSSRYLAFPVRVAGRNQHRYLHHVVAEAFLGPKPEGAWVCHKNDIKADNRPENLYYGNARTNQLDAYRNGGQCSRGERNSRAKLTWAQVRAIRRRYAIGAATQMELAREYGASKQMVYAVVHHLTWKATT